MSLIGDFNWPALSDRQLCFSRNSSDQQEGTVNLRMQDITKVVFGVFKSMILLFIKVYFLFKNILK